MHIFVLESHDQLLMSFKRILELDIDTGDAIDDVLLAGAVCHGDFEVADLGDFSFDGGTVRGFDNGGDGKGTVGDAGGPDPAALQQVGRAELGGDVVKGFRFVAGGAVGGDVGFTIGSVAYDNVLDLISAAIGNVFNLLMDELGDVAELLVRKGCKGRHGSFRAPLFEEGDELLAVLVVEHDV